MERMIKVNIIALTAIFIFSSCEGDFLNECFTGRGSPSTELRGLYPFGNIAVYDNLRLTIQQGDRYSVTISTGHKLIPLISALIVNNTLELRNESPCQLFKDPWKPVDVRVELPGLDSVFVWNYAKVSLNGGFEGSRLYFKAEETSADIELNLNTRFFELDFISGTADINITGKSDSLYLKQYAAGKITSLESNCNWLFVNSKSMNDMYLNGAVKLLDVKIEGRGNVYFQNDPEVIVYHSIGEGKLIKIP
ncbi:MAG: hypothetical protein EOM06_04895 [Sphingobacteriia bacterium]|nr:hypothetical protein [Sphingobacteriia bacterium]